MSEKNDENDKEEFGKGIGYTFGLHIIFAAILYLVFSISGELIFLLMIFFIGVSQVLYILPAVFIAQSKGRPQLAKGFIVGAAITFLLNAACTGFVFMNGFH